MKMKKILALLLACVMTLALLAGCGGSGNSNDANKGGDEGGIPTITWYQVGGGQPSNIASWTEKANAYLEEKIGVHIDIQCVSWGDWGDRRSVIVQTNEPYDIMFTDAGSYGSDVAMGAFADLTDLVKETPGITDLIPAEYLKACEINGRLYAIPAYKDSSMTNFFVWTKEQVEAYAPDQWADVHSLAEATPVLEALKAGTGEAPVLLNKDGISCVAGNRYDGLGVGLDGLGVSYFDGSNKVVAVYEQDDVMDQLKILNQWMNNGLINSDAATRSEATGMCGLGIAQGWPAAAKGWGDGRGAEVVVSQFGDTVLSNSTVQGSMACISASSKHPLEALKVLELVSTDSTFRDMLQYGEEGVNFKYVERDGDKRVLKLNTDWTLAGYTQGTFMTITPEIATEDAEFVPSPYTTEVTEQNNNAVRSPALGFYFDNTEVADKIAACKAIFEGYKGIIHTGTGDPEENVKKMMDEMRASGFDDVVAAVQEQYDAFLAQ